jgi:tight adherence protein B
MRTPLIFFALALSSVVMIALALIVSRKRQRRIEQRLRHLPRSRPLPVAEPAPSASPPAAGTTPIRVKAMRLLLLDADQAWEQGASWAKLVIVAFAAALAVWLKSRYLFGMSVPAAIGAAAFAAWSAARFTIVRERKRMEQEFSGLFPDAVDAIARMLRAGLPVTTAFQIVSQEAPAPVNAVFQSLAGQMKIGMPVEDALRLAASRIRISDFQFFAAAVVLQRGAGGNLLPTLEALGQLMRSRRAVQLKARAATSEVRLTAIILTALPVITGAALAVVSPGYLSPLFEDPRGRVVLSLAASGLVTSALVMRRMMGRIDNV